MKRATALTPSVPIGRRRPQRIKRLGAPDGGEAGRLDAGTLDLRADAPAGVLTSRGRQGDPVIIGSARRAEDFCQILGRGYCGVFERAPDLASLNARC
jgi:hypothetical protein